MKKIILSRKNLKKIRWLPLLLTLVPASGAVWAKTKAVGAAPARDAFGVAKLYPTLPKGREWYSKWGDGHARVLDSQVDPDDPEFDTGHGDSRCEIDGRGVCKVSGRTPRLYVYDHEAKKTWSNVEVTLYGMRVKETEPVGYAGIMAYAKTNHTVDEHLCDDRGYGGRLTYDGRADFEKEISHRVSNGGYVQAAEVRPWPQGGVMPKNAWIGYKFVVRDADNGKHVKLEMWRDLTDGKKGGKWELLTQYTDQGGWGKGAPACAPGVDPAAILTGANLAVYVRTDKVDDMRYKKFSVREIAPLP